MPGDAWREPEVSGPHRRWPTCEARHGGWQGWCSWESGRLVSPFTPEDRANGKVSFGAVADIVGASDAPPGDNHAIAPPTEVRR